MRPTPARVLLMHRAAALMLCSCCCGAPPPRTVCVSQHAAHSTTHPNLHTQPARPSKHARLLLQRPVSSCASLCWDCVSSSSSDRRLHGSAACRAALLCQPDRRTAWDSCSHSQAARRAVRRAVRGSCTRAQKHSVPSAAAGGSRRALLLVSHCSAPTAAPAVAHCPTPRFEAPRPPMAHGRGGGGGSPTEALRRQRGRRAPLAPKS